MKIHELKTWPKAFRAIENGTKTAEYRKNDRGFEVGDLLILRYYNPSTDRYSEATICAGIMHIVEGGQYGIPKDYVVMSIEKVWESP